MTLKTGKEQHRHSVKFPFKYIFVFERGGGGGVICVWNNMRVSKLLDLHFWINYPFKSSVHNSEVLPK